MTFPLIRPCERMPALPNKFVMYDGSAISVTTMEAGQSLTRRLRDIRLAVRLADAAIARAEHRTAHYRIPASAPTTRIAQWFFSTNRRYIESHNLPRWPRTQ